MDTRGDTLLTQEQRIQMIIEADHLRQAQSRKPGRCGGCGRMVLADEEQVQDTLGPLHAACAPFVLLAAAV